MAMPERYLFVCINERAPGHPRGSCMQRGADDVFTELREVQGRHDLTNIKVVYAGCLEACTSGPVVAVVPDNVWYGGVTVADCEAIITEHVENNRPVEMLRLSAADFIGPDY
ncbi:MAG: ferredoxin [Mycobacteriales bacterium]|nr:(2Fe-2S) ferredoxin domain-containing protein [Frankia sp.]